MTTTKLKVGDKVSWKSTQGKVTGTVKKNLQAPVNVKMHHVAVSSDNPQLLVESAGRGQVAAHKLAALKREKAR